MDSSQYSPPVAKLLTLGEIRNPPKPQKYARLGITAEHAPELIKLALEELSQDQEASNKEVWAPIHALQALTELRSYEAIEPLLPLWDLDLENDDWTQSELKHYYLQIGPPALPTLIHFLTTQPHTEWSGIFLREAISEIGERYAEVREESIAVLSQELRQFRQFSSLENAFIISHLCDLEAVEALPLIREAFKHKAVELDIIGDLEEVEIAFGVRAERSTPAPRFVPEFSSGMPYPLPEPVPDWSPRIPEPIKRAEPKIGRNDPCPCGSGKKYKKCCLNKQK